PAVALGPALRMGSAGVAQALSGDAVVSVAVEAGLADRVGRAAIAARPDGLRQLAGAPRRVALDDAVVAAGRVAVAARFALLPFPARALDQAIARRREAQDGEDLVSRDVRVVIRRLDGVDTLVRASPREPLAGQGVQAECGLALATGV